MDNPVLVPAGALTPKEADFIPALSLAFVGDTYYDLYVRTRLVLESSASCGILQKEAVKRVRASGQAEGFTAVQEELTPKEMAVARKGRNAHPPTMPRHATAAQYHQATAMETLLGYLYLTGETARAWELMKKIYDATQGG